MKIGDVEKITGLTIKAIRLYEDKGLISVGRKDNSYREYNDDVVMRLKQIKSLRDIGVGLSEISLYFNNVITLNELLENRKKEIEKENENAKEQYEQCLELLKDNENNNTQDSEFPVTINESKAILGLDIGTTSISVIVVDIENNKLLETYTVLNDSKKVVDLDLSEYDACWIADKSKRLMDFLTQSYPNIVSIGLTGQMHGVVYVDDKGAAVSSLYTWQDQRGNRKFDENNTYCEIIKQLTGYTVFPGFGFATMFYNKKNNLQPSDAKSFCTIMDYVAMTLAGRAKPLMHASNAASLGLYNVEKDCFDSEAAEKLELSPLELPCVAKEGEAVGYYKNIPITVAIGDNQASFYGSVRDEECSALVNFGTGSQISVTAYKTKDINDNLEMRPYLYGKYLLCGSALCGGRAYSILEKFFTKYVAAINGDTGSQYDVMNVLAEKAYANNQKLKVSTQFSGTRKDPTLRGFISEIDSTNFTPENLTLGFLQGMVDELKYYFELMKREGITQIVASGNAVQKNSVLRKLLEDTFGCEIFITDNREEAAFGAALYSSVSNDIITEKDAKNIIKYKGSEK